jgi:hypothetical protein
VVHQELAAQMVHQEVLVLQEYLVKQELQVLPVLQELQEQVDQDLIQFKILELQEF